MTFPEIVFDAKPQWVGMFQVCAQIALENVDSSVQRPGWKPQMTCMPGVGKIWQWDSCFMAIYAKYLNGKIAPMNNLDDLYSLQSPDGYISMAYLISEGTPAFGNRINPPLYAWVEWQYYCFAGDQERLHRVLPILIRYFDWIKANRRLCNGLYYFEDSHSSGMDNSPRGGYTGRNDGCSLCWVDLACQMVLSANCIVKMATVLNEQAIVARFQQESEELSKLINQRHYSEKIHFYLDCYEGFDLFLGAKTVASFWSLIAEVASPSQARELVRHLLNPDEFNTPHPVPSLSRDDVNYEATGGYWLGSVWAPTNYMIVKGLDHFGWYDLSREISRKHIDMISQVYNTSTQASIWECYSPETAAPATRGKAPETYGMLVRDRFVGWSAIGPIALMIEDVIGLDFDAPTSHITWRISERGRHGIRNLNFNNGVISLLCNGLCAPGKMTVEIESTIPFTLQLAPEGRSESAPTILQITPGKCSFMF